MFDVRCYDCGVTIFKNYPQPVEMRCESCTEEAFERGDRLAQGEYEDFDL